MIRDLVKLADKLDSAGLLKEADVLDGILRKLAKSEVTDQDYRNLLSQVCNSFNGAHTNIRARTGRQDGKLAIVIGGTGKPSNYAVVESATSQGAFGSAAELTSDVNSRLDRARGPSPQFASLKIISSEAMNLSYVDQDDEPPTDSTGKSPGSRTESYSVWVLKTNIDNTTFERAVNFGKETLGV